MIDDCNREALAIEVATSISSKRVIRTLEQLVDWRGKPAAIWVDNGPEFTSAEFTSWCKEKGISVCYIQPGKPMLKWLHRALQRKLLKRGAGRLPFYRARGGQGAYGAVDGGVQY